MQGEFMSSASPSATRMLKLVPVVIAVAVVALLVPGSQPVNAQQPGKAAQPAAAGGDVARVAYIVNNVAMCPTCHTPRTAGGQLDRSRWLQGGPVVYWPA